jgi:hypothetical protein
MSNNTKSFLALLAASQLPPEQSREFILKHTGIKTPDNPLKGIKIPEHLKGSKAAALVALKKLNQDDLPKPQPLPKPPTPTPRKHQSSITINNPITINATGGDPKAIAEEVSKVICDISKKIRSEIEIIFKGIDKDADY